MESLNLMLLFEVGSYADLRERLFQTLINAFHQVARVVVEWWYESHWRLKLRASA
jgi:hypothetical protein